jgi:hypothetical protein
VYLLRLIPNLRAESGLLSLSHLHSRFNDSRLSIQGLISPSEWLWRGKRAKASESSEWPLISSVYYCCITTGSGICSLSHRLSTPLQRLLQRCVWPAVSQYLGCAMAATLGLVWCGVVHSGGAARVCGTGRSAVERPLP